MEDNVSTEGEENNINVRNGQGVGDPENEEDSDEEEQQFDISLAASHSYMGNSLTAVSGRSILEPGWEGEVPVIAHHGTVFPGETVPMLLTNPHDAEIITRAIQQDKLFGLLCPDETGTLVSGYGVLCEVFEVGGEDGALSFKARATHRVRCPRLRRAPAHQYARMRPAAVRVLPELRRGDPLRLTRLAGLAARRPRPAARRLDAALTPWPPFVYDMLDYRRLRAHIQDYFRTMALENVPEEPVSLSFWTASNLALSARDRLALFVVDDALLRLHMEVRLITRKSVLCCSSCAIEIARREHIFAMSSEGVHSNYTNLGGYMHDIVTVSRAVNTELSGAPSAEFSWFPGYAWSVALCAACMAHVGWRFDAQRRALRPQRFYGLCRNYVTPRCDGDRTPPSRTPPPPPPDAPAPAPAAALAAALSALGPSPRDDDDDDDDHSA